MLVNLLFIILLIYVVGQIIKWAFPRLLMWYMHRKMKQHMGQNADTTSGFNPFGSQQRNRRGADAKRRRPRNQKIFGPEDGEYVEFEDIPTYHDPSETSEPTPPAKGKKEKDESQISDADWEEIK